jgi:3-hydroxybutyryl-CoA dehydratase
MPLEPKVGDTFSHSRECDRYRPIFYAAASGDFNPIHIDPEVGAKAGLGGAILQGLCTMAWAVEAAANFVGDPGKIRRVKVRFSHPVAPGDLIRFEGKVTAVEGRKMTSHVSAKNQKGEDVLKVTTIEAEV